MAGVPGVTMVVLSIWVVGIVEQARTSRSRHRPTREDDAQHVSTTRCQGGHGEVCDGRVRVPAVKPALGGMRAS
jgi:hypothetical protein